MERRNVFVPTAQTLKLIHGGHGLSCRTAPLYLTAARRSSIGAREQLPSCTGTGGGQEVEGRDGRARCGALCQPGV